MHNQLTWKLIFGFGLLTLLSACGGDGGGDDGTIGTGVVELSGTAAVGKPIANATVTIKDRTGKKHTTKTDDKGRYRIELDKDDGPYIVRVEDSGSQPLYSAAAIDPNKNDSSIVANVHKLSDVSCRNWFGARGRDVDSEFASDDEIKEPPQERQLAAIRNALRALLRLAYTQFGIKNADTFDFDRTPFDADNQGFDSLLHNLTVTITKDKITILLRDPATGLQAIIIIGFDLGDDLAQTDNEQPSVPTGLAAIPASTSGMVVVWNSSTDNIGIAGYDIYRDDTKIATSPYPVYSDTNLTASTQYCYAVEAFDGAGNHSGKTTEVCASTLAVADGTAPSIPQSVAAKPAGAGTIVLAWLPSPENDVLGYDVYRGPQGAADQKIATTIASGFTDEGLVAGTTYCYRLKAFDAALNRSEYSAEICPTTQPDNPPSDTAPPTSSASPMGGAFSSAQTVTLSCTDNGGSDCAAIYYTTDGGEPTSRSSVYVSSLSIATSTTLRFFAVDQAGNAESPKHVESYVIDTGTSDATAPTNTTVANFIDSGAASTNATSVMLAISATDNVAVTAYCAQDNSTGSEPAAVAACWTALSPTESYSGAVSHEFANSYSPGDTAHVFVRFRDAAGLVSAVATDSIAIVAPSDGAAPVNTTAGEFINSGAANTSNLTVTLSLAATDNVAVTAYFVSGGVGQAFPAVQPAQDAAGWVAVTPGTSYSASVNYTFFVSPVNGDILTAHVWFKDAAGNVSSAATDSISYLTNEQPAIFSDNFENVLGTWFASNGVWEIGLATSGPGNCFNQSSGCAATVLDGNYPDTDSNLMSPSITLPAIAANEEIQLRFWHWFSFAPTTCSVIGCDNDYGRVFVQEQTAPGVWSAATQLSSYVGNSGNVWTRPTVDLSAYAGKKVRILFGLVNGGGAGVSSGWYIDDVAITVVTADSMAPFAEDYQGGLGHWWASNGTWDVGGPPTTGPGECHTASSACAATVLSGNYTDTDSNLVSPSITLPAIAANEEIQLRFWHWFSFAPTTCSVIGCDNDHGRVYIQEQTAPGVWSATTQLSSYVGNSGNVWTQPAVDLSAYAGKKVRLLFGLVNGGGAGVSSGWYIDDVAVTVVTANSVVPFAEDYQGGLGPWWASNGTWEVGGSPTAGPGECHNASTVCAATVLNGNYTDTNSNLVSPSITLPTIAANEEIQLRFWHWFSFAPTTCSVIGCDNDYGRVYIQEQTAPGVWSATTQLSSYAGNSGNAWTQTAVDLSAYAGKKVRLLFGLVNGGGAGVSSGWYIDDVSVIKL